VVFDQGLEPGVLCDSSGGAVTVGESEHHVLHQGSAPSMQRLQY
jgi:hypothetical protein